MLPGRTSARPFWKTVGKHLQKLKTELPSGPAAPLRGAHPKEEKPACRRDVGTREALFTPAKERAQPESRDGGTAQENMVHTLSTQLPTARARAREGSCHVQHGGAGGAGTIKAPEPLIGDI